MTSGAKVFYTLRSDLRSSAEQASAAVTAQAGVIPSPRLAQLAKDVAVALWPGQSGGGNMSHLAGIYFPSGIMIWQILGDAPGELSLLGAINQTSGR